MTWTDQNASNTAALLKTTPLVAKLNELRPAIEGRTLEDKAMSASVVEGFELCIKELVQLSQQVTQPAMKSSFVEGLEQFENRAQPIEQ